MVLLLGLLILMTLAAAFLFTRLFALKKEAKNMANQLRDYNDQRTNKKIEMALFNREMERIGVEINRLIDLHGKEKSERIRFEQELKQTIANISHDLRTPLTSVIGYVQLAESGEMTEEERSEALSIAIKRAKRLESLLQDFFELSVIESADHELKMERMNVKQAMIDVLMSFYDRFQDEQMEPTIELPEHDVFIMADHAAVARVIENVMANAIHHASGKIVVKMDEQESVVRLIVQNDAPALTENEVAHLFHRFYMADQSRSGKRKGLGLSIVKSFMEKMNGDARAELVDGQLSIVCEWNAAAKPK